MDSTSRETLDRILATDPNAISDADRDFLFARRSYLTEEQRSAFGISEEAAAPAEEEAPEEDAQAKKAAKK